MNQPLFMRDSILTIEADDFAAEVSSVKFVPSTQTQTWQGLKPDAVHTAQSTATWTLEITLAQDLSTADSLARYLFDNEGLTKPVVFRPKAGGMGLSADVVIAPGAIGGDVNAFASASVSLGVKGRPALVAAA